MTVELVTGYANEAHITAADDGWRNAGLVGSGMYVLNTGNKISCTVSSNTAVIIGTGDIVMQGRHIRVHSSETVAIDNGATNRNRNDIVCMVYRRDTNTGIETAALEVVKGTAVSGTPTDPVIPSGSILSSASVAYMPLWRIPITGINIGTPEKLYGDVLPSLEKAGTGAVAASRVSGTLSTSNIPNHSAAKITSGTLDAARIPSLDAAKIGSGTLDAARLPVVPASKGGTGQTSLGASANALINGLSQGTSGLSDDMEFVTQNSDTSQTTFYRRPISKIWSYIKGKADAVYAAVSHVHSGADITTGTVAAARIAALDASKITTGTFGTARIPSLDAGKITSGTLGADRIPSIPATKITSGTLAVARGGTGAATAAANMVFAAPANASGAPSFRSLVASDVPSIPASKVGSGTLDPDRIPNISAAKVTSGQLGVGRMPYYQILQTAGSGNLTLTETAANFTYIEVFYRSSDSVNNSVKIYSPNGKTFRMQDCYIDSHGGMFIKSKQMKIEGTSIALTGYAGHMYLEPGEYPVYVSQSSGFTVYRVIGYK